jgi:hypothetical protein
MHRCWVVVRSTHFEQKGNAVPMLDIAQELMTPHEAARWFRRSASWLRQQADLVKLGGPNGQPLYHTHACRAFVYGRMCDLNGESLRKVQLEALAAACGIQVESVGQGPKTSTQPPDGLLQLHTCSDSDVR